MVIPPEFKIEPLVLATVEHAIREARHGNYQARRWLFHEAVNWLEAITGYHPVYIRRAITAKLKAENDPPEPGEIHPDPPQKKIKYPARIAK